MKSLEQVLPLRCQGESLIGVLSRPAGAGSAQESDTAVLIIVGGPQYRVGSHRQFVLLARRLAEAGHATLRFDHRGLGDSGGALRSFEHLDEDIGAALDALQLAQPACRRVVLWGLCDAASAALLYCQRRRDPRVAGLCLLNPWVRSAVSQARTQVKHYYLRRLLSRGFWSKLLRGGVALSAPLDLFRALLRMRGGGMAGQASMAYQERMAEGWLGFAGPILLQLSELDYTAREFIEYAQGSPLWSRALQRQGLRRELLRGADHTLSLSSARREAENQLLDWLQQLGSAPALPHPPSANA